MIPSPCEKALARLNELLDGELDEAARAELEEHFRACSDCDSHRAMEAGFRKRVHEALSGTCCPEGLRDRILSLIDEEDG